MPNARVAGIAFSITLAAIFALGSLPLAGAVFVAVLATAIVALLITVWALTRRHHHGGRGGGGYAENRGSQDDGMPPYYATSTLFDSTSDGTSSSPDDIQRSCRFDAVSDSAIGYSDSGSSGGDCGGSASDSGGGSGGD